MTDEYEALRKALAGLSAETRQPWRQVDDLPYIHATADPNPQPWGSPVVGRFDYLLDAMPYVLACHPTAITALLAEVDALRAAVQRMALDGQADTRRLDAMADERDALLADARRYRHIRSKEHNGYGLDNPATIGKFEVSQQTRVGEGRYYWMEDLDAAIDTAMKGE